ncbi:hypothetical protein FHX42_001223 [Saccharopolyspora lacisalsi]|uniref:Uncharacterized protein n=1 Tax=Halosaccharopolyspora lacisalsi TaxID=1000566 RepID=A0A839DQV4_9PSEU|nr:hypothetical protein [Halosaccharopolyspora lacisalsi]
MRERPVWEAEIPTAALRTASCPRPVLSGIWQDAPELHRKYAGEALMSCADGLAHAIGAEQPHVPGYYPHIQHPDRVNSTLAELWTTTSPPAHKGTPFAEGSPYVVFSPSTWPAFVLDNGRCAHRLRV